MHRTRWIAGLLVALLMVVGAACTPPANEGADAGQNTTANETTDGGEEAPAADEGDAEDDTALGSEDNPLVMSFVPSGEQEDVVTGGEAIGELLEEETGLVVETNVATSYAAVVEAMGAGNTHIGWLNTFSYILANEKFDVEPILVTERFGTTSYAGQIIAPADSDIESMADLAGTTFCRPDELSTSGWIIPSITMQAMGIEPETDLGEIVDAGNHDAVVTAVYNGDCDAGATYADARSGVEEDYPDVMEQLKIVQVSDDIPNDNVSVIASLPDELKTAIADGLLAIAASEDGQEALTTVYGIEGLQPVDDTFYDQFRVTLDAAGVGIEDLAQD